MSEEWRRLLSLEAGPLLTVDFPLIYELRRPKEGPFWAWSLEGKRALDHNGEGFMRGQCVSDCSPHLPSPPDTKQVLGEGGSRDAEARVVAAAAAAAKSLQSCLTLCDPIDGSPPGSSIPGILQARTLEWVAISFSKGTARNFT